jgi:hypothetical protein
MEESQTNFTSQTAKGTMKKEGSGREIDEREGAYAH